MMISSCSNGDQITFHLALAVKGLVGKRSFGVAQTGRCAKYDHDLYWLIR